MIKGREAMEEKLEHAPSLFKRALEVALEKPGRSHFTQLELHELACCSRDLNECVKSICFSKNPGGKLFLDENGFVQPLNVPVVHPALIPLVLEGFVPMKDAVPTFDEQVCFRNAAEASELGEELSNRFEAIKATGRLSSSDWQVLDSYALSRSRSKLNEILSPASVWAVALGIIKFKTLLKNLGGPLLALLGLRESDDKFSRRSSSANYPFNSPCSTSSGSSTMSWNSLSNHANFSKCVRNSESKCKMGGFCEKHSSLHPRNREETRTLLRQWAITRWLHHEIYVNKNQNVKNLVNLCTGKRHGKRKRLRMMVAEPSCQFIRLLVDEPFARDALANNVIDVDELIALHQLCGVGHVKHVMSEEGLAAIKSGKVLLQDLRKIRSHDLVLELLRHPDVLSANALEGMRAPRALQKEMISKVIHSRSTWRELNVSSSELLRLPSPAALEFVLSPQCQPALKWGLLEYARMSPAEHKSAVRDVCSQSSTGRRLKEIGVVVDAALADCYINSVDVLGVVLSDAGATALAHGKFKLQDLANVYTSVQARAAIEGSKEIGSDAFLTALSTLQEFGDARAPKGQMREQRLSQRIHSHQPSNSASTGKGASETKDATKERVSQWARRQEVRGLVRGGRSPREGALSDNEEHQMSAQEVMARLSCSAEDAYAMLRGASWNVDLVLAEQTADTTPFLGCALNAIAAVEERERSREAFASDEGSPRSGAGSGSFDFNAAAALDEYRADKEQKQQCIESFMSKTKSLACSREDAVSLLRANCWNVESAIEQFHDQSKRVRVRSPQAAQARPTKRYRSSSSPTFDEPTSDQLAAVLKFLDITGVKTEDKAVSYLKMCNWNVELAVATFLAVS